MRNQKEAKERKKDIVFEICLNVPFILFWLISQFIVSDQKVQRIGMIAILWMASINSTILIGMAAEYLLKSVFIRRTIIISSLSPMALRALLVKLLFMLIYAAIVLSSDVLTKSFLFLAPYVWLGWLIFWGLARFWFWIR